MNTEELLINEMNIDPKAVEAVKRAENRAKNYFKRVSETAEYNSLKVLNAFRKHRISYAHFGETSGYGYDDLGRDTLDEVFADIFHAAAR